MKTLPATILASLSALLLSLMMCATTAYAADDDAKSSRFKILDPVKHALSRGVETVTLRGHERRDHRKAMREARKNSTTTLAFTLPALVDPDSPESFVPFFNDINFSFVDLCVYSH